MVHCVDSFEEVIVRLKPLFSSSALFAVDDKQRLFASGDRAVVRTERHQICAVLNRLAGRECELRLPKSSSSTSTEFSSGTLPSPRRRSSRKSIFVRGYAAETSEYRQSSVSFSDGIVARWC